MSITRVIAFLCAAGLLAACDALQTKPAAPRLVPVANADFEADFPPRSNCPEGWGCVMHSNPRSFRYYLEEKAPAGGKRSLCIEPLVKEHWARAVQTSVDKSLRGARLRLSMTVRAEGAQAGNAEQGAGPFIAVQGGSGNYLGQKVNLTKSTEWRRLEAELVVPEQAFVIEYGLALVGPGRACADDVRLEIMPAP